MQVDALSAKQVSKGAPRLTRQWSSMLETNQDYDNNAYSEAGRPVEL
jgi:hypothetical protein